jgi:hypothetical protein
MLAQLGRNVGQMTPFLRSDRQPLDAAAVREDHRGDADEANADPYRPPILFAE